MKMSPYYCALAGCAGSPLCRSTNLFSTLEEEGVGVHAIGDGVSNDREPVENNRRFIWVLEQELAQDIEDDGDDDEGRESSGNNDGETMLRDLRI